MKSFECSSCGGFMEWDPERQCLSCPNCGSSVPVMRDVPQLPVPFEWGTVPPEIGKLSEFSDSPVICPSCHADIRPREETVSMLCPYCGTALVFDEKQSFYLTPNGVVPEAISLRQAMKSVEKWSRTHFFAPTVFPKLIEKKFIRNCYVPFWVFSANIAYSFEGVGSTFSERAAGLSGTSSYLARKHRREQKSEHQCSGRNRFTASDVRICASSKLSRAASDAISAVSYGKVCDYRPEYLAGRIVDLGNIGIETGMKQAEARMREMVEIHAKAMIMSHGYTSVRITSFSIKISDASYSQILIPCYRIIYRYAGKLYSVVVNGENGRAIGDYPLSVMKAVIIPFVLCMLLAVFLCKVLDVSVGSAGAFGLVLSITFSAAAYVLSSIRKKANIRDHGRIFFRTDD